MTSLITGGEAWTEALSKSSGEDFEELEARLFGDDLFAEPSLGPVLRDAVEAWQQQVVQQFGEWQDELSTPEQAGRTKEPFFLFGGYSAVRGLREALEQAEGLWHFPRQSDPIGLSGYGAVLMATGLSDLRASVLPRSLVKVRDRRRNLARLKEAVLYAFFIVAIVLGFGLFKQSARLDQFATANREANATLAEMKAAAKLLEQRDALRARIEPVVDAQLNSRDSLETFRKIQAVREAIDFTLIRFVDRQTYFQGMDEEAQVANSGNRVEPNPNPPNRRSSGRLQAFVVELTVPGGQAERLQLLGEIVGRLREEPHFANVDRLLNRASAANGMGFTGEDESYALLLTLAGEHSLRPFNKKEGAGR